MFGVDKGGGPAFFLGLGGHMQRQRRLAGTFRTVDFDNAALWQSANAERDVEAERAGGNRLNINHIAVAKAHERALAESLVDL